MQEPACVRRLRAPIEGRAIGMALNQRNRARARSSERRARGGVSAEGTLRRGHWRACFGATARAAATSPASPKTTRFWSRDCSISTRLHLRFAGCNGRSGCRRKMDELFWDARPAAISTRGQMIRAHRAAEGGLRRRGAGAGSVAATESPAARGDAGRDGPGGMSYRDRRCVALGRFAASGKRRRRPCRR
jgi:hypothetical protein